MKNYKPFRNQRQKALAKANAKRCEDGVWRSNAPVSFHGHAGEYVRNAHGEFINTVSKMPLVEKKNGNL